MCSSLSSYRRSSQSLEALELSSTHISGIVEKVCELLIDLNQYRNESGEDLQVHGYFLGSVHVNNTTTIHKTL